ncbi:hypothetical protein FHX08_000688 [Rhizobium sp. BK529]|nr:hypothetical protein [Rhizobium sp. BK529]
MFFWELVSSDNIDDEHAFRHYAIEGDMPSMKDAAKAGAEFAAVSSHERRFCEKFENPVQVNQIGVGLRFAEGEMGIFVNA